MADATPHERWTDAPVFDEVGADQPVKYFLIAGADGQVQGAMYLGVRDHFLGYLEKVRGTGGFWNGVCSTALRNNHWDGRQAFDYWSSGENDESYSAGPISDARNLGDLEVLVGAA